MSEAATAEALPQMFVSIVPMKYWEEVEPFLRLACEREGSGVTVDQLKTQVREKKAVLFGVVQDGHNVAAGTLERRVGLRKTQMVMTSLGGDNMADWIGALDEGVTNLARAWGCDQFICVGRPGWQKVLQPLGYKMANIEMTKDIEL